MSSNSRTALIVLTLAGVCALAVACANELRESSQNVPTLKSDTASQASINAIEGLPHGPQGALIAYGRDIIADTPKYAGSYITARLSCSACHPKAGTTPHAGSLVGSYAKFPQWNKRAHRFIALQDRIAECFLYSMNGHPPAYYSHEMLAITEYIAWISRGAPTGEGFPNQDPVRVHPPQSPSAERGHGIYLDRCAGCHKASGAGVALIYPPLWGPASFNDKAGMSRTERIVPFIKFAMPQNAPGSLSDQEAADVAAYILLQPRPHFNKNRSISFPSEPSGFF